MSHELKTPLQGIIGSAEEKNVKIDVTGSGFTIKGVRRMIQEIIYNLCDNAIKYNVPGANTVFLYNIV